MTTFSKEKILRKRNKRWLGVVLAQRNPTESEKESEGFWVFHGLFENMAMLIDPPC